MKVDKKKFGLLSSDIEKYTRVGSFELQRGNLEKACEAFEFAYRRSLQLEEGYTERACALNLGAIYIAVGQAVKGLEFLQKAVPPMNKKDNHSNGDLYYNFGIGYEGISNVNEAARHYELAAEEYMSEVKGNLPSSKVLLDIHTRLSKIYSETGQHTKAAKSYGNVAVECERLGMGNMRAQALSQQGSQLMVGGEQENAIQACDKCYDLCQTLQESSDLAKVYNQLGLIYTQCKMYAKAATCFELALPMTRGYHLNRRVEAVVLQNLGAVYNSMGDYQRAVSLHEEAVTLHGQVGNRSGQGQCFMNLAFAFSQTNDHASAGDAYLHALQAAKDTDDKVCQWQALEGSAGVACLKNDTEKAITYYKQALSILAVTPGSKSEIQERIVGKLTDALKEQVTQTSMPQIPFLALHQASPASSMHVPGKRDDMPVHHDLLHAGLGEYLAESDNSLSSRHHKKRKKLSKKKSPSGSESERTKGARTSGKGNQEAEHEYAHKTASKQRKGRKRKDDTKESLLRDGEHNSEDEWLERMKMVYGTDSDTSFEETVEGYEERTRAPSVPPPALFDVVKQVREPKVRSSGIREESSDEESSDEDSDSETEDVREQMREISARAELESDDSDSGQMKTSTPNFKRLSKRALDKNHNVASQNLYKGSPARSVKNKEESEEESDSDSESGTASDEESQQEKQRKVTMNGRGKQPVNGKLGRKNSALRRGPLNASMKGRGLEVATTTEDDDEEEAEKPPVPTTSPPGTLNATYESPSVLDHSIGSRSSRKKNDGDEEIEYAKTTQGTVYSSLKPVDESDEDEGEYDAPPTLPARNYSKMSRAQRDIMMYEYSRQHTDEGTALPEGGNRPSKSCTIL